MAEKYLRASGLDWTIVRPGGLKADPPTGALFVSAENTLNSGEISRDLVADVSVAALFDPRLWSPTRMATPRRASSMGSRCKYRGEQLKGWVFFRASRGVGSTRAYRTCLKDISDSSTVKHCGQVSFSLYT